MASAKKISLTDDQIVLLNAATIAQELGDPRAPKICPLCVYDFIIPFAIQQVALLSKKSHAFWDTIVAFVALRRSDMELTSLESSLTALQKGCSLHRTITKPYNALGQSLVQIALDTMMRAIFNVLNPEPTAESSMKRAHSERRSFGDATGKWPQAPRQLLPYGAEASLQAYVCWAADPLLPWALLTISSLNVTVYPLVLPVLVESTVIKRMLAYAIARSLSNPPMLDNREESAPNGASPNPDRTAWDGAFGVLTGLHLDPYSTPAIRYAFVGDGVAEILFPALYNFLARSGGVPGDRTLIASHWLSITYYALPVGQIHSAIPLEFHMRFAADRQQSIQQYTVTDLCYKALRAWEALRKCTAAGCTTQLMTLDGTVPLLRCNQCKTARYCSRKCQRLDWRDGELSSHCIPHKELCPAVTVARSFGAFDFTRPKPHPDFGTAFESGGALEKHAGVLIRWTRGSGLLQPAQVEHLDTLLGSMSGVRLN